MAHVFRLFSDEVLVPGQPFAVPDDDYSHVTKVLRGRADLEAVGPGRELHEVELRDGVLIAGRRVALLAAEIPEIWVALGVLTGSAWSDALDHITQCGATRIIPVSDDARERDRIDSRRDRSERVVRAAARQAKRVSIPTQSQALSWHALMQQVGDGTRILLDPGAEPTLVDVAAARAGDGDRVVLAVGGAAGIPETAIDDLTARGWAAARLTNTVLRAELAAAVAAAQVRTVLGP